MIFACGFAAGFVIATGILLTIGYKAEPIQRWIAARIEKLEE